MFTYQIIRHNQMVMVQTAGDMDFFSCPDLEQRLTREVAPGSTVAFHLGNLEFIDSSGIGFLLRMNTLAESRKARFCVVNPKRIIAAIFLRYQLRDTLRVQHVQDSFRNIIPFPPLCHEQICQAS